MSYSINVARGIKIKPTPEQVRLTNKVNRNRPEKLTLLERSKWPSVKSLPHQCWHSRHFIVQIFIEPTAVRLTINRTTVDRVGGWDEEIQWAELQEIKQSVGYGNRTAVEIYPKDCDIINVANMRHLWIPKEELTYGWKA